MQLLLSEAHEVKYDKMLMRKVSKIAKMMMMRRKTRMKNRWRKV
jgi:hypothetical protein